MLYGYARVSTRGQAKDGNSLEAQENALRSAGATKIYADAFTGTKTQRPELDKLMAVMQSGDTMIVAGSLVFGSITSVLTVPKITKKYGKDAFEFRENAIVVKIPFNWINVMGNKLGDKMGNKVGNKYASSTEQNIHLNETQLMILNFIRDNNNITKKQLQEKIRKSKTTVDNTISFLREHGLITRI